MLLVIICALRATHFIKIEVKDMKHTLKNQFGRSGIALAAIAFLTFGTATALAAPPTGAPAFAKADISIEPRGEGAGSLNCSWRETGLGPLALVSYECNAAAGAVVEGCFFRNKFVADAGTETTVQLDISNVEAGHDPELFIANNSGAISGELLVAPEAPHGGGGGHLCAEPLEVGIIAARYCDMSLTDTTNGLVGTTEVELFEVFARGVAVTVPSCAEMLAP